jgi:hypothetical protein
MKTLNDEVIAEGTVFLGRTPERNRVHVDIQIIEKSLAPSVKQTVDHGYVSRYAELSISGKVTSPGWAVQRSGQVVNAASEVLIGQPAVPFASRLVEVWDEWHLNGMQAGCAHQPTAWICSTCGLENGWHLNPSYPKRGDACVSCEKNRWDEESDRCPVSGYRYGTSWLLRDLPSDLIVEIKSWIGNPDGV